MSILLKNANLISLNSSKPMIEYGIDIFISDDKISDIGKNLVSNADVVIDCTNKFITPGFINCHTHAPMSFFKEIVDGLPLQRWLNEAIWPIEAKMKSEDFYFFSLLNFLECVENGVTCINDMYFDTDQIIKAQKEIGIEQVTTVTLMNPDGDENGLKRMEAFRKCRENNPDSLFSIGIHGFYTTSPSYIKKCVEFAKEMNINLIHIHFCENDQEVADIKKIHNVSHPADALKNNFEGFKMVLAHSVILEEYDMKIMGEMNASISHNPISNCRLGCGFSDIVKLSKFGVNVALGTDGDGSSCSQSILKNARLACFLQKGIYKDPTLISAYEALKMATINGAKALGLEDKKGSIEIGKDADLNIINLYEDCLTFPVNDPVSDIIYNAEATNIETVIIKGKIIINNKQHTSINKKELFEKCLKLSNEIKSR